MNISPSSERNTIQGDMKGYSFTFGAYRKLDHIDGCEYPSTFIPERKDILKMKCCLSHSIFGIDGVMEIVRDYLPGGALLPTDLFPSREVDTNEAYQLLYSVACCSHCTEDVMRVIRKLPPYLISVIISQIRVLHLLMRCGFLGGDQKEMNAFCVSMGINTSIAFLIKSSQIYNDVRDLILQGEDKQLSYDIIRDGVLLRISEGAHMADMEEETTLKEVRLLGKLDAIIIFGKRRDMKRLRKTYGVEEYYRQIRLMAVHTLYLNSRIKFPTLGLEEKIVLSIGAYRNLLAGHESIIPRYSMESMFSVVREILLDNHVANEIIDGAEEQSAILTYEGKRYTVGIRKDNISGKVFYACGNGVTYSYCMLLFIIVHRFIFTYDRDFLIKFISEYIIVDEETALYFDIPTSRPPIHDLIIPRDVFSGNDILDHLQW